MISVFNKSAITNDELAGVGRPILDNWAKEATYFSALNGEQYVKVVIPHRSEGVDKKKLPNELDILKIIDMNDEEDYYRVRKIKITLTNYEIYAEHITYDLIDNFIEEINIVGLTGQTAMDHISMNTQFPHRFKLFSDINKQANIRIVQKNPMEAIIGTDENTFINRMGGELQRLRFTLSMKKRIGKDLKDSIRSSKNLTGFEREIDIDSVATRILPKGPNGILLPGKYVDSPLINNYPHPTIKVIEVKSEFEGDFEKLSDLEKQRVYSEMRQACKKAFDSGIDKPKATYKVNFVTLNKTEEYKDYRSLESVNLGDTLEVYEEEFDIYIKARVVSVEYDLLNKRYKQVTLGAYQNGLIRNQINTGNNLAFKFDEINKTAITALKSANGKNTNYYSDDEPQNPDEGDLWFKSNGTVWQYEIVDGKLDWVEKTINKERFKSQFQLIESKTKELLQEIQDAEQRANQVIADAGFETLGKANQKAEEIALQKYNEAINEAKRLDGEVRTEVNNLIDGIEIDFSQMTGGDEFKNAVIQATVDSINQTISTVTNGNVTNLNHLSHTVNGMQHLISNPDGLANQILASNLFKTEIANQIGSSVTTQMADSWSTILRDSGDQIITALNATDGGVSIKGDLIRLDGTTLMDDAFANNIFTKNLTTESIRANSAVFANAIVDQLDVNRMTGYSATWVENVFNGVYSKLKITGDNISIVDNNGYSTTIFHNFGMQVLRRGKRAGWFQTYEGGVGVVADSGNDLVLGYRNNNSTTAINNSIEIAADTGDISMYGRSVKINGYDVNSLLQTVLNLQGLINSASGKVAISTDFDSQGKSTEWRYLEA
ncbi:phage tail spike protein [Facklamia miroungae]|uniref:Phage minor structural protein, N-terminal region n=1 Tax=Facklamia miroungae TaxID=120956 RepID=A0A1G7P0R2_9LACT|nr:phage tail spike protein [Facklamia miroungae]NKZ28540.1 hypothetical protein [Facklamia miroungae]SDF79833.1 phage minor structural protein, N-terminal region [Facklamia miroungae]